MTLTGFLLDRIAEDERLAQDASTAALDNRWEQGISDPWTVNREGPIKGMVLTAERSTQDDGDVAAYVAAWHPARVLAECDAKRRILALHLPYQASWGTHCDICPENTGKNLDEQYPCDTLKLLALPYSDHPDYQEAWRP